MAQQNPFHFSSSEHPEIYIVGYVYDKDFVNIENLELAEREIMKSNIADIKKNKKTCVYLTSIRDPDTNKFDFRLTILGDSANFTREFGYLIISTIVTEINKCLEHGHSCREYSNFDYSKYWVIGTYYTHRYDSETELNKYVKYWVGQLSVNVANVRRKFIDWNTL